MNVTVSKPDRTARREVQVTHFDGTEIDHFVVKSAFHRRNFIKRCTEKFDLLPEQAANLEDAVLDQADAVDDGAGEPEIVYERITSQELATSSYQTNWLIRWTLAEGQPCILAGGKKTLKTSIAIDLAISLAHAVPFLGQLQVPEARRVMVMSGESGLSTIQETARRIAQSKGLELADMGNLIWSSSLPQFGDRRHHEALAKFLADDAIEVLLIDPCYLCMPGGDAGNLMIQGQMLRAMAETCQSCGVTMILLHHTRKNLVNPNAPPELEDIAWSGFQEFARQWMLIGRRTPYEPGSGDHRLWLNIGGSAGHSSLWGVDIAEGQLPSRIWDVNLLKAADVREQAGDRKTNAKRKERERQTELDAREIVRALVAIGSAETKSVTRDRVGISTTRMTAAMAKLIDDGTITPAVVTRANNHTYDGYVLAPTGDK